MKKDRCRLSVIIPVYNAQESLKNCVESILRQTYSSFELILVDDGSVDYSGDLCDAYAAEDSRVRVLHQRNGGPYQARKAGVRNAKGEIVTFCDADDWLEPNAFETAMKIFAKWDPDMFAYAYLTGDQGVERHLYPEKLYSAAEIRSKILPGMLYDPTVGRRRLNPSLCCKYMKKALYTKVTETVTDRITLGEDALVAYPAVCDAKSLYLCNGAFYHYNSNPVSCTRQFPLERIVEVQNFQDNLTRLFQEMGLWDILRFQTENYVRHFLAMMVKNWYGMELSPIMFRFPYHLIFQDSRLVIYGAGNVGKSYLNELQIRKYIKVVGWADQNYKKMELYNGVRVMAPEEIKDMVFDQLLIAVDQEEVAMEIREDLIHMGIAGDKIIWEKPICVI
ncbi:MAG: glycosyltransferase [Hespellia sp.]|nr:glycosyltransferase [Hespellia sp.]